MNVTSIVPGAVAIELHRHSSDVAAALPTTSSGSRSNVQMMPLPIVAPRDTRRNRAPAPPFVGAAVAQLVLSTAVGVVALEERATGVTEVSVPVTSAVETHKARL